MKRKDCWKQDTPRMQLAALTQCVLGHLLNMQDGLNVDKHIPDMIQALTDCQEILKHFMPEGEWEKSQSHCFQHEFDCECQECEINRVQQRNDRYFRWLNKITSLQKRIGSAHEEMVITDRTFCKICGWIELADPNNPIVQEWHGDSFEKDQAD